MDTPKSDFKSALDYFWNSWASAQQDIVLIVCGSAASWIVTNLLSAKLGFHNRITRCIHLFPFTLAECEKLLNLNDIVMTRSQIIECYMVFGGIPHYLNQLDSRLSLSQNINELCFKDYGLLHDEYTRLIYSLYDKPEKQMAIIEALAKSSEGLTRTELSNMEAVGGGSVLTKNLRELEECGFIKKFTNYKRKEGDNLYQLIDPFILFSIRFINNKKFDSWNEYINSPGYNSWRGNSFETVCINHIEEIKSSLGISGIETNEFAFKNNESQIDLIISRKDGVINLCEMKYTNEDYSLDLSEYNKIQNRLSQVQKYIDSKKAVHITLVCANGFKPNKYSGIVQNVILGDDLFK